MFVTWEWWTAVIVIACVVGFIRRWFRLHAEAYVRGVLRRRYGNGGKD